MSFLTQFRGKRLAYHVAKQAGINIHHFYSYENGGIPMSVEVLLRFATTYKVKVKLGKLNVVVLMKRKHHTMKELQRVAVLYDLPLTFGGRDIREEDFKHKKWKNTLREQRGELSQTQMAKKIGISQGTYSALEAGKREPRGQTRRKLEDAGIRIS